MTSNTPIVVEHVVADPHASPFPALPAASISMLVSPLTMVCHDTYVVVNIDLGGDGGAKTAMTQTGHGNSFCLWDITKTYQMVSQYVDGWIGGSV